jgi:hypothetical protein
MPRLRREKSLTGGGDQVHPGLARDFFEKSNIATNVIGRQIDDGADAGGLYGFEPLDGSCNEPRSTTPCFRPSLQHVRRIANVLMCERKPEIRRIDSSENRLSSSNAV